MALLSAAASRMPFESRERSERLRGALSVIVYGLGSDAAKGTIIAEIRRVVEHMRAALTPVPS